MIVLTSAHLLLARRGRFFEGLFDGDPVAWGILGVVVLFMVGSFVVRSRSNKGSDG